MIAQEPNIGDQSTSYYVEAGGRIWLLWLSGLAWGGVTTLSAGQRAGQNECAEGRSKKRGGSRGNWAIAGRSASQSPGSQMLRSLPWGSWAGREAKHKFLLRSKGKGQVESWERRLCKYLLMQLNPPALCLPTDYDSFFTLSIHILGSPCFWGICPLLLITCCDTTLLWGIILDEQHHHPFLTKDFLGFFPPSWLFFFSCHYKWDPIFNFISVIVFLYWFIYIHPGTGLFIKISCWF